jgi:dihydroorotate dehydrogenase (NAD+) catalytic subunit
MRLFHKINSNHPIPLNVSLGSIKLKSPIVLASGTSGHSDELSAYGDLSKIGAITVKSLCLDKWEGNPLPRIKSIKSGVINSVGLQGRGIKHFIDNDYLDLEKTKSKVILSIWGRTVEEFGQISKIVQLASESKKLESVIGVELNISCPNVEDQNKLFGQSTEFTFEIVNICKSSLEIPIFTKLTPVVSDPVAIARAATDAGSDVLTLTNTMFGIDVDTKTMKFSLGNIVGGISGSPLKPVSQSVVAKIRETMPEVPIVGVGGIFNLDDLLEYLFLGANAVGIGTATFFNPRTAWNIQRDLCNYILKNELDSFEGLWNKLQKLRIENLIEHKEII